MVTRAHTTTEIVPIVTVVLSAATDARAGDAITYVAQVQNRGSADAKPLTLAITLPDGTVQTATINPLAARATDVRTWSYAIPANTPTGSISATARVTWLDQPGNHYGTLSSSFPTNVRNTNQAPAVSAGTDQSTTFPQNAVTLAGSATDPDGDALTLA